MRKFNIIKTKNQQKCNLKEIVEKQSLRGRGETKAKQEVTVDQLLEEDKTEEAEIQAKIEEGLNHKTEIDQECAEVEETMGIDRAWLNLDLDKGMEVKERRTNQLEAVSLKAWNNSEISTTREKTSRKSMQFMMSSLPKKRLILPNSNLIKSQSFSK